MSKVIERRRALKARRKARIRKRINGTAERPRLSVVRTARHVYAQVIDDSVGRTLASASSFERGNHQRANVSVCFEVGRRLAERCQAKKVSAVAFDKNGNRYHGRVKSLADGAREGGLNF